MNLVVALLPQQTAQDLHLRFLFSVQVVIRLFKIICSSSFLFVRTALFCMSLFRSVFPVLTPATVTLDPQFTPW